MATQRIVVGQGWVQVTADSTQKLIECVSGVGVLVAASAAPRGDQAWGHLLRAGEPILATEPTFARASQTSGNCILIVT